MPSQVLWNRHTSTYLGLSGDCFSRAWPVATSHQQCHFPEAILSVQISSSSSTLCLATTAVSLKCGVLDFLDFPGLTVRKSYYVATMHIIYMLIGLFYSQALSQRYVPSSIYMEGGDITQPGSCPADLPAFPEFEFPHLAVPISITNPDKAYPNTLTPYVTAGDIEMVFNFDIPVSRKGQTCVIEFILPNQTQLSTSFFALGGDGEFTFSLSMLGAGAVSGNTTYNNKPLQADPHGFPRGLNIQPGHAWAIGSTIAIPGQFAIIMSSSTSSLTYFEDWNPCPIGL